MPNNPPIPPPRRPGGRGNQPTNPRNTYEVIGLIKGLDKPEMKRMALHLRQQILINILLSYIGDANITSEIFKAGFDSLSNELRNQIGQPIPEKQ